MNDDEKLKRVLTGQCEDEGGVLVGMDTLEDWPFCAWCDSSVPVGVGREFLPGDVCSDCSHDVIDALKVKWKD